jgi:repressor LexA
MTAAAEPLPLTDRQREVLDFIKANIGLYGPTVREIAAALSISSPNGVVCHLDALERKGYIRRESHKARAIEVIHGD